MVGEYLRHIITSKSQQTNRHNVQRRRLHPPSRFVVSLRFLSSERVIWNHKQKLMPWLHHCFYIRHPLASSIVTSHVKRNQSFIEDADQYKWIEERFSGQGKFEDL
eukprot:scaffold815_cov217-Alexandrium_tamarense.AAC.1